MFEGSGFPASLEDEVFEAWLERGRQSKIGHLYLLVVWDQFESAYQPVYTSDRQEIARYQAVTSRERLVAAYDLYSESRIV